MKNTKQVISETFMELSSTKNIDNISVTEICKKAHVSRETFYYHFHDKFDLYVWCYRECLIQMIENNEEKDWQTILEKIITFCREKNIFNHKTLSNKTEEYSQLIYEVLYNFYCERVNKKGESYFYSEQLKVDIHIYLKGSINLISHYFNGEIDLTTKQITQLIVNSMPKTLSKIWVDLCN